MTLETLISPVPDNVWNDRLVGNYLSTVHQTSDYTEYIKKISKQPSFYIHFKNNNDVVGQMVLHRISRVRRRLEFKLNKLPFASTMLNLTNNMKPMYVWHFGPSIFNQDFRNEIFHEIAKLPSKIGGPIKGSVHPMDVSALDLVMNNWKEKKIATILIDLTKSEEELWNNIDRQSGRKAVKRALNKGVKITSIENIEDLKIHHKLLNEGMEIAKLGKYPFRYLEESWNMLKNIGQYGFVAWLDDKPLASTLMTTFNGYVNEWGFARSKYDRDNLLNGPDLIKWQIIKWGHESKFRIFDLSGIDPSSSSTKDQGILKFKKKWGGTIRDWYHYTFV